MLRIEDNPFRVVGILAQQAGGRGGFNPVGVSLNDAVVVPYSDLRTLFPGPELVLYAIVKLQDGASAEVVKEEIRAVLRETGERNASLVDFEDLTNRIQALIGGFRRSSPGSPGSRSSSGGSG